MRFLVYCHGCQEEAELEIVGTHMFIHGHGVTCRSHVSTIRLDRLEEGQAALVAETERFLTGS